MIAQSVLSLLVGPYEFFIMLLLWGVGLLVLVLPVIYAVFAIRERRHLLEEIESLRQEVRDLGQRLEGPLRPRD